MAKGIRAVKLIGLDKAENMKIFEIIWTSI
jgi:hypothetical protein